MAFGAAARRTSLQLIEGRLRRTNEHRALGWRGCIWPKAGDTMSDYLAWGRGGLVPCSRVPRQCCKGGRAPLPLTALTPSPTGADHSRLAADHIPVSFTPHLETFAELTSDKPAWEKLDSQNRKFGNTAVQRWNTGKALAPYKYCPRSLVLPTTCPSFSARARSLLFQPLLPSPWMRSSALPPPLPHPSHGAEWTVDYPASRHLAVCPPFLGKLSGLQLSWPLPSFVTR